jgi:2-polyprenyl-3-methyl-5-hydroxy-6-metoxy-1,4-benzoquinol methylase
MSSNVNKIDTMTSELQNRRLRFLVAIASFGEKNLEFLKKIIHRYQSMAMDVDIVVLSNVPKDLGPKVRVIVGLPAKNPWSLPFGHKALFAKNVERYDLFAYSEDDMDVTEKNIQAFLRVTPELESREIAGYLRYEIGSSGIWSLPEVHAAFHWKPESIVRRNGYTIGEFTNEHAAFYLLTQAQLREAIASGGFLRGPCVGRYDMLCTAATDPYINCGFRKVICVSALEDFLIHHVSNRYVGQLGLPLSSFKEQIKTIADMGSKAHPASALCQMESKLLHGRWSKSYYEKTSEELLEMLPKSAKSVLSIGCGSGDTEVELKKRGIEGTAIPLDSIIGAAAERLGINVVYGTLDECFANLGSRQFDCVLMTNLLHLLPNPKAVLERSSQCVRKGGTLLISGPNFGRLPILIKKIFKVGDYWKLRSYAESGINTFKPQTLKRHIERQGLRVEPIKWIHQASPRRELNFIWTRLGRFAAKDWIIRAQR